MGKSCPLRGRSVVSKSARPQQTQRQRRATAGTNLSRTRALAADPHIFEVGRAISGATEREHRIGGRPLKYPDWCLVLFGACIRVYGSASATARAMAEPLIWSEVVATAASTCPEAVTNVPPVGPNRD